MVPFFGELLKPAPSVHGHEIAEAYEYVPWVYHSVLVRVPEVAMPA